MSPLRTGGISKRALAATFALVAALGPLASAGLAADPDPRYETPRVWVTSNLLVDAEADRVAGLDRIVSPIDESSPRSALRRHPGAVLFLDCDSAALLNRSLGGAATAGPGGTREIPDSRRIGYSSYPPPYYAR